MKPICSLLLMTLLILSVAVVAVAREGPNREKAFTHQAIVADVPAPVIQSVPPLTTGFDVICNITNVADTSARVRLGTTVAERTLRGRIARTRNTPAPLIVLLA